MPNRRASTAKTRPGQKRTTSPNSKATRPRSARARQLAASVFSLWVWCVRRKPVVDSSVELCAEQHHRSAEVEVEEQTYGSANAPVGGAVVGEVGQVKRKSHRGDRPQHYRERRARDH